MYAHEQTLQCSSEELQQLKLEAVLDLRVLKKHCRREADQMDADIRRTDSREKANQMRALNPDGASSSEDVSFSALPEHVAWSNASILSRQWKLAGLEACRTPSGEKMRHLV